jgi:DNA primase
VKLSQDAKQSLEQATQEYSQYVDLVGEYLAKRGVTKQTADTFLLGYVDKPIVGHEQYEGRLAIPYNTPTGIVDIRFRSVVDDESPKYLSRPGAESHLFNVTAFQLDSDVIAVCEGEMDTMITHAQCGIPAVGIPGSNGWKQWYSRAFTDYRKVIVLCDGDQPGKDLGKRIAQQIDVAVVVSMPDGMDVNEVYLNEGPDGIRGRAGV